MPLTTVIIGTTSNCSEFYRSCGNTRKMAPLSGNSLNWHRMHDQHHNQEIWAIWGELEAPLHSPPSLGLSTLEGRLLSQIGCPRLSGAP